MNKYLIALFLFAFIFKSYGHVNITYPAGAEEFAPQQVINIEWGVEISHNTQNWDIYFSADNGQTWEEIQLDISADARSYEWTIPNILTTQGLIKVIMDNEGEDYEDISGSFTISNTTSINLSAQRKIANVYPNPFTEATKITFKNPEHKNYKFTLYNVQGKIQKHFSVKGTSSIDISRGELVPGIYIFRLTAEDANTYYGKLKIN